MSGFAEVASSGGTRTLDTHDAIPAFTSGGGVARGDVVDNPATPPSQQVSSGREQIFQVLRDLGATNYKISNGQVILTYPWDQGMDEKERKRAVLSNNGVTPDPIEQPLDVTKYPGFETLFFQDAEKRSKLGKGQADTASAYVASETDKADEVTRQFKDFLARAQGVYDLRASEQNFAMKADDQNAANMKNARAGLITYPGDYAVGSMDTAYSRVLAPSVPSSVPPIYKLNGAVGLGGTEGFDNPNYSSTGAYIGPPPEQTPASYATTQPVPTTQPTTNAQGQQVIYGEDGTAYVVDANGNLVPQGTPMLAMGTDYHAMLMRKLITGGK